MKYKQFDDSQSSLKDLNLFKENFELLQVLLKKLEQQLMNKELTSNMQYQIDEINKNFKSMSNKGVGLSTLRLMPSKYLIVTKY